MLLQGNRDPLNKFYKQNVPNMSTNVSLRINSILPHCRISDQCLLRKSKLSIAHKWHRQLSHSNYKRMSHMTQTYLILGIPNLSAVHPLCEVCVKGKQSRHKISKARLKGWRPPSNSTSTIGLF